MSKRDGGREALELLASTYVLCLGVVVLCFLIFAFAPDPTRPIMYIVGGYMGFVIVAWLLRDKRPDQGATFGLKYWLAARKPEKPFEYQPRRRRGKPSMPIPNEPPSARDVREMKEQTSHRTWVPAANKRKGKQE